jgi:hypothetical protein
MIFRAFLIEAKGKARMKCSNCEYLYYPEYESNYTSCRVFGDEIPDNYSRKDEEGCICNRKQLAKMFRENEKAWMEEAKSFADWYKSESEDT